MFINENDLLVGAKYAILWNVKGHAELKVRITGGFRAKGGRGADNFVILTRFGVILSLFVKVLLTITKVTERR